MEIASSRVSFLTDELSRKGIWNRRNPAGEPANGERTGTYVTTLYSARRGNLVFNAGTCWWNVVLSSPPGFQNPPRKDFRRNDRRIQRITKNILDRMIGTKLTD